MLKQLLTGFALIAAVISVPAKPITPDEALSRLRQCNARMAAPGKSSMDFRLIHTTNTLKGTPAVYIFNRGENSGYMIVAADDTAYPLLGYSNNGNADATNLPPAFEWWLSEYARQIEYASSKNLQSEAPKNKVDIRSAWEPIEPLIKTHWDQMAPYYNMCPLAGLDHTYTGCVATAMAQVAKYWNYPEIGKGSISYECDDISKRLSMNFALKKFDWDKMRDTYVNGQYTEEEADAVAYLMKACGYSVRMSYSTQSSGALAMNIANGMKKYLNYDPNIVYDMRIYHSTPEWEKMIYDNLKNVGPIIYGGGSMLGGGHSFVCDGYDGNGMFHFNWGWSGTSDGYFALDAINPDNLGAGGGAGGGYNFTQDAVFGIQPPTGKPEIEQPLQLTMQGSLVSEIADGYLTFDLDMESNAMWVNYNPQTMNVEVAAAFAPQGKPDGEMKYFIVSNRRYTIRPGYGFMAHSVNPETNVDNGLNPLISTETLREELADGVYKVSFVTRDYTDDAASWQTIRCPYGYYDYVTVTKSGSELTVKDVPAPSLDIDYGEILTTLMPFNVVKVAVDITNPSDIELTTGLAPVLAADGHVDFMGESVFVTVPPHETVSKEWYTSMSVMRQMSMPTEITDYQLLFLDEKSMLFYDFEGYATMYPQELPDISQASDPQVTNASSVDRSKNSTTYYISDPTDIEIVNRITIKSDEFAYPILSCLCLPEGNQIAIMATGGSNQFFNGSPMPRTINTRLNYPQFEPGVRYLLYTAYIAGGYRALESNKTIYIALENSGVDNISTESTLSLDYDRSTMEIKAASPCGIATLSAHTVRGSLIGTAEDNGDTTASLSLADAPQGIVIVRATDIHGDAKTIKIVR